MTPVKDAELTVGNGAARIVELSRAENEQLSTLAQIDTLAFPTTEDPRWSGISSSGYSEDIETEIPASTNFVYDDGLISMLDDGQIPQQLISEEVSQYLHPSEADLRRNLLHLLSQLKSDGRRMAEREDNDAGWGGAGGDGTYFNPHAQYGNQAAEPPAAFSLTNPSNTNSLPVTCTFGTMRDGNLSFVSQDFRWFEASQFPDALNSQAEASVGMVFLTITNWQPWFLANLKSAVPNFPVQSVLHLSEDDTTTMLPLMDRYLSEMSCVTEHIDIAMDHDQELDNGLNIGSRRTKRRPLVVWTAAKDGLPYHAQRPLVVVIGKNSENMVSQIAGHYVQMKNGQISHVRWERLRANQTWVYLDLYNIFTKWDKVWAEVKTNLKARTTEMHGDRAGMRISEQAKRLHFDTNVIITLREHLRAHKASLGVVIRRIEEPSELQYWQSSEILSTRLDDAMQLMDYYDQIAGSLLERQQNLLSLSSTLENASRGQTISSLNILAVFFLPLILVASIFGIHSVKVSPIYIPVAAAPALILTIVVAYFVKKHHLSGQSPRQPSNTRPVDVEKFPAQSSVSTFNYPDVQQRESPWYVPRNIVRHLLPSNTQSHSQSHQPPQEWTTQPAHQEHVPIPHHQLRSSFQSARPSSPPYHQRTNQHSPSVQSSGNSTPRLPHLPVINPLWPPTTFPSFDNVETPMIRSPEKTVLRHPRALSPRPASALRDLSPNVTIRRSSSRSPSREVVSDVQASPAMVEILETAFLAPIPLRHPHSHIAYQLAEANGSESNILPTPQETVESGTSTRGSQVEALDVIIARGMGDITDTDDETETGTETGTARSSSEMSSDDQIDYLEIARRQAEAYGFGVGFATSSAAATEAIAPSESRSEVRNASPIEDEATPPVTAVESFGNQQIVHDALRASGLSVNVNRGYVGRLVSRFESVSPKGKGPEQELPTSPGSPALEAGMYVVEQHYKELGIYNAVEYERQSDDDTHEHVELYDAEEDDFRPPQRIAEQPRPSSGGEARQRSSFEPPMPIPPRNSSHFATMPELTLPQSMSRPITRTNSPLVPGTPPAQKTHEEEPGNTSSSSSDDSAVTARSRPLGASVTSQSLEALGMYDSDGFYASPRPPMQPKDEHAEHPGGLEEQGVLDLMEDDSSAGARTSWVEDQHDQDRWEQERQRYQLQGEDERRGSGGTETVTETEPETEGEGMSSEVENSDMYDEDEESNDDGGDGMEGDFEHAPQLSVATGLGPAGLRASVASGGSYSMGYLDTIPE